jgi:hypothetical protein
VAVRSVGSFFVLFQFALPYLALTGGLAALIRLFRGRPAAGARLILHALVTAAVVSHAYLALGFWAIFSSTSSTAGIGLIYLPLYGVGVAIATFVVAGAAMSVAATMAKARQRFGWAAPRWPVVAAAAVILAGTTAGGVWGVSRLILLGEAESAATSLDRLDQIAKTAIAQSDVPVMAKLARNPASDERILGPVFDRCLALGPIDGQAPCYRVFANIAANWNTPSAMLELLAEAPERAILSMVGMNRNTSPAALERLARSPEAGIRYWVAINPALPLPALSVLADDPDDLTRRNARAALQRRTGKPGVQ